MNNNIRELLLLFSLILILGFSGTMIYKQGKRLNEFSDQIEFQERIDNWFANNLMFSEVLLSGNLTEQEIRLGGFDNKGLSLILSDHTCQSCMETEIKRLMKVKLNNEIVVYCVFESKRKFQTFQNIELKDFRNVKLVNCKETTWNYLKDPIYCMMDDNKIINTFCVDPHLNTLTEKWLKSALSWVDLP